MNDGKKHISISFDIKQSKHGDEYYSPQDVVDVTIPYVEASPYKKIWCPFDKAESKFVQTFQSLGYEVVFGHIETGQDFFAYTEPLGGADIVVSNPPFSKRDAILERLFEWGIPFALVMNMNGLFDNKKRYELFRKNGVQLLVPRGRMRFIAKDKGLLNAPNFQSIYVCSKLLSKQIVFSDAIFQKG